MSTTEHPENTSSAPLRCLSCGHEFPTSSLVTRAGFWACPECHGGRMTALPEPATAAAE